jgi:prevent-host-death family protein
MIKSNSIKPISYIKTHASEIVRELSNNQSTLIITQNGEAKAVLQDINIYEQTQETLALLKILALSNKSIENGNIKPLKKCFNDIKESLIQRKNEKL